MAKLFIIIISINVASIGNSPRWGIKCSSIFVTLIIGVNFDQAHSITVP